MMRTSQDRPGADLCPTGQSRCELGNAEFGLLNLALAHYTGGYPRDPAPTHDQHPVGKRLISPELLVVH